MSDYHLITGTTDGQDSGAILKLVYNNDRGDAGVLRTSPEGGSMQRTHKGIIPRLHPSVFVAEGARIIGDVEIGESSSVWFNAVIRGDILPIRIGRRTNIQDGCILHTKEGFPLSVGDEVTFGHSVTAHGCAIGDLCLLGIGCIVLDGAVVGKGSVIGSGAVVPPGTVVSPTRW